MSGNPLYGKKPGSSAGKVRVGREISEREERIKEEQRILAAETAKLKHSEEKGKVQRMPRFDQWDAGSSFWDEVDKKHADEGSISYEEAADSVRTTREQ